MLHLYDQHAHPDHPVKEFEVQPIGTILQPVIEEAVQECGLSKVRKGTKLRPVFVVWVVLFLTLRRDLNSHQVISWLLAGWRWIAGCLPAASHLVSDGALSHARRRVGRLNFRREHALLIGIPVAPQPIIECPQAVMRNSTLRPCPHRCSSV